MFSKATNTRKGTILGGSATKTPGERISSKHSQRARARSAQYAPLRDITPVDPSNVLAYFNDASVSNEASESRRWAVAGHFALFHLPAVAVTVTLLCLYALKFHWPHGHPTAEELAALQFAAKGHEALILISLTDVLLYRICYGLLNSNVGVPLGFISSPFYLGSPIQYLFSPELWSAIRHSIKRGLFQKTTGPVIVIIALLCIGASPFSAVAMIPRETWRRLPKVDIGDSLETVHYVDQRLYGLELDSQHVPNPAELTPDSNCTHATCAPDRRQLQNLFNVMYPVHYDDIGPQAEYSLQNVTYTYYDEWSTSRTLSLSSITPKQRDPYQVYSDMAVATCPMAFLVTYFESGDATKEVSPESPTWLVKTKQMAVTGATGKWKQPLVFVNCEQGRFDGNSVSMKFNSGFLNDTIVLGIEDNRDLRDLINEVKRPSGTSGYRVSVLGDNTTVHLSGDILFATRDTSDQLGGIHINLCLISARWVESDVWIQSTTSSVVQSHLGTSIGQFIEVLQIIPQRYP